MWGLEGRVGVAKKKEENGAKSRIYRFGLQKKKGEEKAVSYSRCLKRVNVRLSQPSESLTRGHHERGEMKGKESQAKKRITSRVVPGKNRYSSLQGKRG